MSDANSEKSKALQAALAQIEKQFGKGTIMRLGEGEVIEDIQVVSTGSLGLDIALGVGGLPRGRVVEIYGPESSGKTTLALHAIAEAQKRGLSACFVDAEHALDPSYASRLGVDIEHGIERAFGRQGAAFGLADDRAYGNESWPLLFLYPLLRSRRAQSALGRGDHRPPSGEASGGQAA